MRALALAAAVTLLAACDAAGPLATDPALRAGGLQLDADRTRYDRGDVAHLTLTNTGTATYWTGLLDCATLERWDGQAWRLSADGNDRPCIAIAVEVAPGGTLTGRAPLFVPDGSYRFVQTLGSDDATVTVATAAVRVE